MLCFDKKQNMTHRLLSAIIALSFISNCYVCGQNAAKLPYPILFVHGWNGNDSDWYVELDFLAGQGLKVNIDHIQKRSGYGSRLDFMLNATTSTFLNRRASGPQYGDVLDMESYVDPSNDVFAINFDVGASSAQSNQAAAAKQGFAVGLAVKKIIAATGAENVILFGHSMGGLAIREYLQNKENWLVDFNSHHIAKAITSGTPHQGSNISLYGVLGFFGYDEWSDAVRDLRTNITANYLLGGHEANVPKTYESQDLDCDGYSGMIVGLNRKPIPSNLEYACIVGIGGNSIGYAGYNDDDVVLSSNANIFDLYPVKGDLFTIDNNEQQAGNAWESTWHTKLTKQTFTNHYALDEPEDADYAYYILPNKEYKGFLTPPPSGADFDRDKFNIHLDSRGLVTFEATLPKSSSGKFLELGGGNIAPSNSKFFVPSNGDYVVEIEGKTGAETGYALHFDSYRFSIGFCPFPGRLDIFADGRTKICEGESVNLKIQGSGYDSYDWFLNDIKVGSGLTFTAKVAGRYFAKGNKCELPEKSVKEIVIEVNPIPARPVISVKDTVLASNYGNGNQWFRDGNKLLGDTLPALRIGSGSYKVMVTLKGCSSESDIVAITGQEPLMDAITVYPNPSEGIFQVKVRPGSVWKHELFNQSGQLIGNYSANEPVISFIPTGLYILQSSRGKTVVQTKVAVK
jgi:pimeloyl-ACP methyl ester carboxylesterase